MYLGESLISLFRPCSWQTHSPSDTASPHIAHKKNVHEDTYIMLCTKPMTWKNGNKHSDPPPTSGLPLPPGHQVIDKKRHPSIDEIALTAIHLIQRTDETEKQNKWSIARLASEFPLTAIDVPTCLAPQGTCALATTTPRGCAEHPGVRGEGKILLEHTSITRVGGEVELNIIIFLAEALWCWLLFS